MDRDYILAPFRIGLDWLTLNMSGPPSILNYQDAVQWTGNRWWMNSGNRTRVMNKLFYLVNHAGEKLLTVAGQPASLAVGRPDWMQVQFANRTLYTGEFLELYQQLRAMGFVYRSTSRLDLAADGLEDANGNFLAPIQAAMDGQAEYYGRASWRIRFRGRKRVDGAELGTRSSNKFFRVYNKSRELKTAAAADKAGYIRASWEQALGFDPTHEARDVYRLELQVKGRETRRYYPEERAVTTRAADQWMQSLADGQTCANMFANMAAPTFDFRTKADRARDAQPVLRWDFGAVAQDIATRERETRTMAISQQGLKVTIKNLWRLHVLTSDPHWLGKCQELAHAAGMANWLDERITSWDKELQRIRAAGGDMSARLDQLRL